MAEVEKQESKPEEKDAESASTEGSDGGEGVEGGESAPASSSKKKKLIALVVAIMLVGAGGATFMVLKKKKETQEQEQQEAQKEPKNEIIFHDMDEMIINLNTEGKSVSFMKLKITMEIDGRENLVAVRKMSPKITDVFQMYLRELRPSDMQGSVGLYRLKEELLLRINKIVYPAQVSDLLFKEVIVQ